MKKGWWTTLALVLFVIMLWINFPNTEVRSRVTTITNNLTAENTVDPITARRQILNIQEEMALNSANYDLNLAYKHIKDLVYISGHLDPGSNQYFFIKQEARNALQAADHLRLRQPNWTDYRDRFHELTSQAEFQEISSFNPTTTTTNWAVLLSFWKQSYLQSLWFAPLFFICLIMRTNNRLWIELMMPWRILTASLLWPGTWLIYPTRDAARQLSTALSWAGYCISIALSLFGVGALKAQSKSGAVSTTSNSELVLSEIPKMEDPPDAGMDASLIVFGDTRHDRQGIASLGFGHWLFTGQARITADGTMLFGHIGAGSRFKWEKTSFSVTVGPQLTNGQGLDRLVLFIKGGHNRSNWRLRVVNRLSFSVRDGPFANRHIQTLYFKPLPEWLSLNAEELRINNRGWRELFFGPRIGLGTLLKRRGRWKGLFVWPHWDGTKGNVDVRVGYATSF